MDRDDVSQSSCGTIGKVLPGSLLGPIVGLTFSTDGALLFACSGSSLWVFEVRSGALLSTVRVFNPGVAVFGTDIHAACEFGRRGHACTSGPFRCPLSSVASRVCRGLLILWPSGRFFATSIQKFGGYYVVEVIILNPAGASCDDRLLVVTVITSQCNKTCPPSLSRHFRPY